MYLGNDTAITRTAYGHKLFVDTRDISLTLHLLLDGDWEHWIATVVRRTVKPGMVAVDIGSNCGFYSLLIADGVGSAGRLYAFEANPRMHDLIPAAKSPDSSRSGHTFDNSGFCRLLESRDFRPLV